MLLLFVEKRGPGKIRHLRRSLSIVAERARHSSTLSTSFKSVRIQVSKMFYLIGSIDSVDALHPDVFRGR
jgi:hypothetical protein